MTPTLLGRLQTRLLLAAWIGLPVTALFSLAWFGTIDTRPFAILLWITVVGCLLDPLWIYLQHFRWDRDWPFAFQFASLWIEFGLALAVIALDLHPFLPARETVPDARAFSGVVLHFSLIFVPSFLALLGFLQVFLPRWRFKGGECTRFEQGTP